jgi:sugar porter (SP) family MFS transporter
MKSTTDRPNLPMISLISVAAALGGFLFGYDTAVINGAVLALQTHFHASSWTVGLSVSLALLGSAIGALLAGPMADRHGRLAIMRLAACLFCISAIGSGLPFTVYDFIFWRLLGGVAVGAASVVAPAYIAEIAPAEWRGRLASLQQLAIVTGILAALVVNYLIVRAAGSADAEFLFGAEAWRWMFWSETPAALLYGVAAYFIPESPRYLVAKMLWEEAAEVYRRVLGATTAALRIREAKIKAAEPTLAAPGWGLLRGRAFGLLPIVWVGIGLSVFQQAVGINVIFYYGTALWRSVGFDEQNALLINVATGITNIFVTVVAMSLVDKIGRKPLLMIGSVIMSLTLGAMAWAFAQAVPDANGLPTLDRTTGLVALIAANAYIVGFGCSWGPVVWVMLGEMFPNPIRANGLALAAGAQWVANFAVSTTFPPLSAGLGLHVTYGLYAGCALLSFFFVTRFTRETKGRELEQM